MTNKSITTRCAYIVRSAFSTLFLLAAVTAEADNEQKIPYWQDVQTVAVNKEYPRSSLMTYDNRADALSGEFERSKYYRLLNGTWKFYFVDSYKDLPANITDISVNAADWHGRNVYLHLAGAKSGVEYFVNFTVIAVEPEPGVQAGINIAHEQFLLDIKSEKSTLPISSTSRLDSLCKEIVRSDFC